MVRDKGAFGLGLILIGNLWAIAGLNSGKEGFQPVYAIGLMYLFMGVFLVYKAYQR